MTDYPRFIGHVLVNNAEEEAREIERTTEREKPETKPAPVKRRPGRPKRG